MSAARDDRSYPSQPIVGLGAVVMHDGAVLLIRRGREPMLGQWSLPGGALQLGETMAEGVRREVLEETGLIVTPQGMLGTAEYLVHDDDGRVRFHYVLVDWECSVAGPVTEPTAADDALAAAWVPLAEIQRRDVAIAAMTLAMIAKATGVAALLEESGGR